MRIIDFKRIEKNNRIRVQARVVWEDGDRPAQDIYIETPAAFGAGITISPEAFLAGSLIPATHFGEKRIAMTPAICPDFKEGLDTAMALVRVWSHGRYRPPDLQIPVRAQAATPPSPLRAAMVLSGGIDSLATLRLNRRHFPANHPGAIRDGLIIHGFDIGGVVERGMKYPVFDRARQALAAVADDADISLIPVYTNIRHLCDERTLWLDYFFGAVLAAAGHAFSSRINLLYIASSFDLPNLVPCGSHPLLDPLYSSHELRIHHAHAELPRMEKLRIVSEWPAAFQNFRVCLANVPDRLNCGKCEKCVRTMLGLVGLGRLDQTRAFIEDDVTPDMLAPFDITIRHRPPFYRELIEPLKSRGRDDLVQAITGKLATPDRYPGAPTGNDR